MPAGTGVGRGKIRKLRSKVKDSQGRTEADRLADRQSGKSLDLLSLKKGYKNELDDLRRKRERSRSKKKS